MEHEAPVPQIYNLFMKYIFIYIQMRECVCRCVDIAQNLLNNDFVLNNL